MSTFEKIRDDAVKEAIVVGFAGGPIPILDPIGMTGVLTRATYRIAKLNERELDTNTVGKIASTVLSGVAIYLTSVKVFSWVLLLIPGLGLVANMGVSAVLDALIALRFCSIANDNFAKDDFSASDFSDCIYLLIAIPNFSELQTISGIAKTVVS